MPKTPDINNPGLKTGDRVSGYHIERIADLTEIEAVFYELVHEATGARHIHISRKDRENTFGVSFKTVPADSTGVAHILEHTVLCGSRKFPVRDPFFSMLKRSLSTFMNAFTASDWTMYPFSTQNRKDFYNLLDVYLDAAFRPLLEPLSFKQEGHRLEFTDDGSRLVYKGVVYNEMRGAMSSPDQIMSRSLLNALYPSTTYRFNSGGDPAEIPRLTHEDLVTFHRRHYHPSNAFFYTYGDLPLKDHLDFIGKRVLEDYRRIDPATEVPGQPRWTEPKQVSYSYPLSRSEDPAKKYQAAVAWLLSDIRDTFQVLVLALLEQVLIGNAASPLRKALIDSGLGSALSDATGFTGDQRDTMFSCGLKDVDESAPQKVEAIIFKTLADLSEKGIDRTLIESAIHQLEFHRKEVTNQPYPYGLKLLFAFSGTWFHGGDPLRILRFDQDLDRIREEMSRGPFFEERIRAHFLHNPHRVLFTLMPDQEMEERENLHLEKELERVLAQKSLRDLEQIRKEADILRALQEKEMDVSVLPTLALSDIPPEVNRVPETASHPKPDALLYRQPTAGIFYFSAAAGAGALPENLLPLVPFFSHAVSRMGTRRRDYAELARLIDAHTGGISLSAHARTRYGEGAACLPFIAFGGKCLVRNQAKMFDIAGEILGEFDFSDLARLKRLLLEYRAGLESSVIHNGHRMAISLASRGFSPAAALDEIWHGVHQLRTVKAMTEDLTEDSLQALCRSFSEIGKTLITTENLKMALIGEEDSLPEALKAASSLHESLSRDGKVGFLPPPLHPEDGPIREGWHTSSAVSFVARVFQTVRMDHGDAPALAVISKLLRSLYLHREIREKGGAYGGFATYNPEDGRFCFASYRDPHIQGTLNVFDGALIFIRAGRYTAEDVKEAILQVCSEIDRPDPPGPAARKAFFRKIISLTDEARSCFKEQLLGVDKDRVVAVAEKYFQADIPHAVAVISGEEQLKAANARLGTEALSLYRI